MIVILAKLIALPVFQIHMETLPAWTFPKWIYPPFCLEQATLETVARVKSKKNETKEEKYMLLLTYVSYIFHVVSDHLSFPITVTHFSL